MNLVLAFDAAAFAILLALSAIIRSTCFRRGIRSVTGAMGIVMAIGIFAAFSLPQFSFYSPWLGRLVTLELLVIWLYIASAYLTAALRGAFEVYVGHPLRRFGIGTWVAGSGVLAVLVTRTLPEAQLLAALLAVIAFAIYLPYVALYVHGYYRLLKRPMRQNARGVILLATVSSQSVLIAFVTVFDFQLPDVWFDTFFLIDNAFLCTGIILIALHFHSFKSRRLAEKWKNTNCIVHGAVSITGLAAVKASALGTPFLMDVWRITLVLFVVIELIELVRAAQRVRRFGLRQGLFVYNTTQWARDFTFGMFYAFSLSLYQQAAAEPSGVIGFGSGILAFVAEWGPFIVAPVLLTEIGIFLHYRLRWPSQGTPVRVPARG